jgi:AraC-like DNA-binding protein
MRGDVVLNDNMVDMNGAIEGPQAYREFLPPTHLRHQVECLWHREAGSAASEGWVLPDGCVDIVWMSGLPPFVAGPMTLPTIVAVQAGVEIVGIRFRPGVAPQLLGVHARELVQQNIPLRDIWPRDLARRWEAAMEGSSLAERLDAMAQAVTAGLAASDDPDPLVRRIVAWIASHPRGGVKEIARSSGLSERQVRRRFGQAVGYGPKTLQRVLRVQRLLWLASANAPSVSNLTRLAFAAGYADQPHMTREVGVLTGATPRQLLLGSRRGSAVSELFKTTVGREVTLTLPE